MIYTALTNKAMKIAYAAHEGQVDKSDIPYILHPFHLAEQMTDEYSVCVALLHDVIEDTEMTLDDLRGEFPEEVVEGVRLMTHEEGIGYYDYVRRLKDNALARQVKLADLAHNSDMTRFAGCDWVTPAFLEEREQKYAKARRILLNEEE